MKSERVDEYIANQKSPQREIVQQLRSIIFKTFPDIKEEFKLGVPWYEGRYYLVALKNHVNLGFSLKGLSKTEQKLFERGGKTMKHITIHTLKEIDEKKIVNLLNLIKE